MGSNVNIDEIITEDTKKRFKGFLKRNQTRKMGRLETIVDKVTSITFASCGNLFCGIIVYAVLVSLMFDVPDDKFWVTIVMLSWFPVFIAMGFLQELARKMDDKYFKESEFDKGEEEKSLSELISNVDLSEVWSDIKEKKEEK